MKTSKTYVIAWDEAFDNCLEIEKQLSSSTLDYMVHNVSSHENKSAAWVRADDIRYFGHFYTFLKDFCDGNHDIFIFNAGDAVCNYLVEYTQKVESLFDMDPNIGLFAPEFDRDAFDGDGSKICASTMHEGLNLAVMTNGIWVAMSREIAMKLLFFYDWAVAKKVIDYPTMRSGWGLDIVYAIITILSNKKIYRDTTVSFHHPEGSTYDGGRANKEMEKVTTGFYSFCINLGLTRDSVVATHQTILDKVRARENLTLDAKSVYKNLNYYMEF